MMSMSSSGPTTTVMTHIILSPPDPAVAWMTAAPLLALMTRRDFDRINNGAKSSMYIIINALVALSPSLFQGQVGFLRPGLQASRPTGVGAGAGSGTSGALRTSFRPIASANTAFILSTVTALRLHFLRPRSLSEMPPLIRFRVLIGFVKR